MSSLEGEKGDKSQDGGKSDRHLAPGEEVKFRGLGSEQGWRRQGRSAMRSPKAPECEKECEGEETCTISAKQESVRMMADPQGQNIS